MFASSTAQGLMKTCNSIARHRTERPDHWRTIEEPYQIDKALLQAREAEWSLLIA
jgi:adenosyl cobinamide kinase/adenosyl cobinamide phosphate guanylyltransferase